MPKNKKDFNITWYGQRFTQYEPPYGALPKNEPAAHALFHYYVTARSNWERVNTEIRYEDEKEDQINYSQLMKNIGRAYGVEPEDMIKHWKAVDFTCTMHNLPKLPDEERYRMDRPIVIKE